jgi:hypothetical protein
VPSLPLEADMSAPEHVAVPLVTVVIAGMASTATDVVEEQPVLVYVMFATPAPIAVTMPEAILIFATVVSSLVHAPPVGVVDNTPVEPTQNNVVPEIAAGVTLTVTIAVL